VLDNPDQRLSSDLKQLTAAAAVLAAKLVAAPFGVAWYGWCTWQVGARAAQLRAS
jgi:hypothetical protein